MSSLAALRLPAFLQPAAAVYLGLVLLLPTRRSSEAETLPVTPWTQRVHAYSMRQFLHVTRSCRALRAWEPAGWVEEKTLSLFNLGTAAAACCTHARTCPPKSIEALRSTHLRTDDLALSTDEGGGDQHRSALFVWKCKPATRAPSEAAPHRGHVASHARHAQCGRPAGRIFSAPHHDRRPPRLYDGTRKVALISELVAF